jgi:iron complex transport system substrate-binding protein
VLADERLASPAQEAAEDERDDQDIVELAGDRDEVRDEVERQREVAGERDQEGLVPARHPRISQQAAAQDHAVRDELGAGAGALAPAGDHQSDHDRRIEEQGGGDGDDHPGPQRHGRERNAGGWPGYSRQRMRICSLLPSATEIIAELGFADSLVGVSDECRWPPGVAGKPVVTAARIDPSSLSSAEIDQAVRASVADGRSLYAVDADLIETLAPDLIVTQDLCAVCAVSSGELESACPVGAEVLSLDPRTLGEVVESVRVLGTRLGAAERGRERAAQMLGELADVAAAVRGARRLRLFFAEWIDPPFCAGHWLPEMIELAGGEDVMGRHAEPSHVTRWQEVLSLEPELVVVAPCGFDAEEAATRAAGLELPCPAVAVDGDAYYSRPAPRLAAGVRQLAHLMHPDRVPDPGLPAIPLANGAGQADHLHRVM